MIPKDKILHVVAGFAIAVVAGFFAGAFGGFALAVGIGLLKEAWDSKRSNHTPDGDDAMATALGGFAGALAAFALRLYTGMTAIY
jgi:hypothetical protein